MLTHRSLPPPSPEALAHSQRLQQHLQATLLSQTDASLSFHDYMQRALYAPGLGYYVAGAQKFGPRGDFITAPDISALFSQCLANQYADWLPQFAGNTVMEIGAGRGQMAADSLQRLAALNALPEAYLILELSPDLQQQQRDTLRHLPAPVRQRVHWLSQLPAQPFRGIIVANEVLDAMPVTRFQVEAEQIYQQHVTVNSHGTLAFCQRPADGPCQRTVKDNCLANWDQHYGAYRPQHTYTSEFNPALAPWLNSLADCLQAGILLLIDYGYERRDYYHPERSDGTLLCHYRHHVHADPLFYPGLQDITASVDFTAVAEAATQAGFQVTGYTTQAEFLLDSGLEALFNETLQTQPGQQFRLAQQLRTLLLPAEMGERFKVTALTKGFTCDQGQHTLSGFRADHRHRL